MAIWTCAGCASSYSDDNPDVIVRHVNDCDYVDGAGRPVVLLVKFSGRGHYMARVRSDELAEVTGGLPFRALRGPVEDGYPDEDAADRITGFLSSLTEAAGPAEVARFEISDVYDARLDQSRLSPHQQGKPEQSRARSGTADIDAVLGPLQNARDELAGRIGALAVTAIARIIRREIPAAARIDLAWTAEGDAAFMEPVGPLYAADGTEIPGPGMNRLKPLIWRYCELLDETNTGTWAGLVTEHDENGRPYGENIRRLDIDATLRTVSPGLPAGPSRAPDGGQVPEDGSDRAGDGAAWITECPEGQVTGVFTDKDLLRRHVDSELKGRPGQPPAVTAFRVNDPGSPGSRIDLAGLLHGQTAGHHDGRRPEPELGP